MRNLLVGLLGVVFTLQISAQDIEDLYELSLEELMNMEISVTSKTGEKQKEAANIVTVLTHDDIEANNCRDLADIINMVPGLNLSKDDDYTTFTSRGLFGFEGRTLIMVDGMQLSDLYFGSYVLGNDFPVHLVERVEIIRGPGSVLYGGTAELAVINIVTSGKEQGDKFRVTTRYGQLPTKPGHYDAGITFDEKIGKLRVSGLGFYGEALRSDGEARYVGRTTNFNHRWESAGLRSGAATVKAVYNNNTELNLLYQFYQNNQVRGFDIDSVYPTLEDSIAARKVEYTYSTLGANLKHQFRINDLLSVYPAFNYQYSYPFNREPEREDVAVQRYKPSVFAELNIKGFQVMAGGEYFGDYATIINFEGEHYLRKSISDSGSTSLLISNWAAYTNLKYSHTFGELNLNIIGGFRYDKNELYGGKFSPRAGITMGYNKFHLKALYSSAFRAPLAGNNSFSRYGLNPDTTLSSRNIEGVSPEKTHVFEVEAGAQISQALLVTINGYYQQVKTL